MKSIPLLLSILCLVSFTVVPMSNPSNQRGNQQNPTIDQIIYDEMIKQNLPGVAVGIIRHGRIIYHQGYGYTDIEKKTPVSQNTIFRWASISKTLTAIATLQMAERGMVDLDDKVNKYLIDDWPTDPSNLKSRITIKHLLMHRSGINQYGDGVSSEDEYDYDTDDYETDSDGYNEHAAIDVFDEADLDFEPNSDYLYTSFGYNLLGSTLEEAYKDGGYIDWVEKYIANKDDLEMPTLDVARTERVGYRKLCDGELSTHPIGSIEWKLPSGGWESNIHDLAKFALGILNDSYLKNSESLWENFVPGNDEYRYGVYKSGENNNKKVWHGGANENLRTLMYLYPTQRHGVVVMCYAEYANCDRIIDRIYNDFLGISRNTEISPVDTCSSKMESCKGKFAAIWRKTGKDVIIRRGYSHKAFLTERNFLRSQGYYCEDFDAYEEDGQLKWDGVFKKGIKDVKMWRNSNYAEFKKKWDEQNALGFHLVDLETYTNKGKRKWAGLFAKGRTKKAMFRNLSTEKFGEKRAEMAKEGLKLIDIEVYESKGRLYWSGVWKSGTDGLLNRNYSTEEFGNLWNQRRKEGFKLIDIEAYRVKGQLKWTGIWEQSPIQDLLNREYDFCGLMDLHETISENGYELSDLERY